MKIIDCGPLAACTDCALLVANDDATDAHRARFAAWQDAYGDGATLVVDQDHGPTPLSPARCDGCGDELAGDRFDAVAIGD